MSLVLQLERRLEQRPSPSPLGGVSLRNYRGEADIPLWLELRHRSFARQRLGVRAWNRADFQREFLDRPWWNPDRMWFAEAIGGTGPLEARPPAFAITAPLLVGAVTLAQRGPTLESSKPVVHWLCVLPPWRRQGVGRLLMATLEAAVWDSGGRLIMLETHSAWNEAVHFYRSLGYSPVQERTD